MAISCVSILHVDTWLPHACQCILNWSVVPGMCDCTREPTEWHSSVQVIGAVDVSAVILIISHEFVITAVLCN